MQRLPAALTNNPTALWPSLIRTRKYVEGNPFKSDTTPFTLSASLSYALGSTHSNSTDVTNGGLRHKEYDGTRSFISPTPPGGHALRVNLFSTVEKFKPATWVLSATVSDKPQ